MKKTQLDIAYNKIKELVDLDKYIDSLNLSFDAFAKKYGHYGFTFKDALTVRFQKSPNILFEICKLLDDIETYYIVLLKEKNPIIEKKRKAEISTFLSQNNVNDFMILDVKNKSLLLFDNHRRLHGYGDFIKKKMKRNINLKFGELKLMFVNDSE